MSTQPLTLTDRQTPPTRGSDGPGRPGGRGHQSRTSELDVGAGVEGVAGVGDLPDGDDHLVAGAPVGRVAVWVVVAAGWRPL
ncbi:hypothetical protein ATKI12_8752 [Kitasatospora sp. Ki12]